MAADVGLLARIMSGYIKKEEGKESRDLVTRDFLGGCAVLDNKDLDLELGVSLASEKRRNLTMDNMMYLQKHDLNLWPTSKATCPAASSSTSPYRHSYYQSVCTIDKVKSALARVERESQSKQGERSDGSPSPSPSSSSVTCSSTKRRGSQDGVETGDACDSCGSLMAAACPSCLLYVMIPKENPRCPRCDSHVPALVLTKKKKPRIDLNATRDFF